MTRTYEDPLKRTYAESLLLQPGRRTEGLTPALLCVDLQQLDAARDQGIFRGLPEHAQRFYFERLEQVVVPNVKRLQRAFRENDYEVIHVRIQSLTRDGRDRSPAHKRLGLLAPPGSENARFLDQVAPRGDELVINKTTSGVFASTNLAYVLRNIGVDALVIAGVYTDECVSTTARVGSDIGFYVSVVEDACTTVTPELHRSAIATLRDRYARIVDTDLAIEEARGAYQPVRRREEAPAHEKIGHSGPERCVVLFGGSAFARGGATETPDVADQFDFAERSLDRLVPLLRGSREVVIGHGNGPQIGRMLARAEAALGRPAAAPLEVLVAETEGELGYVLQQSLHNTLREHAIARSVASVLTQTVVDAGDPAFEKPLKPIGPVYDEATALGLREKGYDMCERERGWQRVVASPEPLEIVEIDIVQALLRMGVIVVAVGGGGVPVVRTHADQLEGVDAVVDKDLAGSLLARSIGADRLIIVTDVPCVYRNFGTDAQQPLHRAAPAELADEGPFEAGTMAPKVDAACRFAESGGTAIICSVDSLDDALAGRGGTTVAPPER